MHESPRGETFCGQNKKVEKNPQPSPVLCSFFRNKNLIFCPFFLRIPMVNFLGPLGIHHHFYHNKNSQDFNSFTTPTPKPTATKAPWIFPTRAVTG